MGATASNLLVLEQGEQAAVLLEPTRLKLMGVLGEPTSAAELARKTGEPRQRINYHLKELERVGLVKLVEERRKGNCVERIVQAAASAYVVSPAVLGALGGDASSVRDKFSSAYLIAVAAESIAEVAKLRQKAEEAGKKLATLTVQTSVRVASPDQLSAFGAELAEAVAKVAAKYHDASAQDGREFKVNLTSYPAITRNLDEQLIREMESRREAVRADVFRRPSDVLKGEGP